MFIAFDVYLDSFFAIIVVAELLHVHLVESYRHIFEPEITLVIGCCIKDDIVRLVEQGDGSSSNRDISILDITIDRGYVLSRCDGYLIGYLSLSNSIDGCDLERVFDLIDKPVYGGSGSGELLGGFIILIILE